MMNFITYEPRPVDVAAFVSFWSLQYRYKHEQLYDDHIGKPLTPQRLRTLYRWKNGTRLSTAKQQSVEINYVARLDELLALPLDSPVAGLLERFGASVWDVFFLHCWQPARYPIYDQHVHRAMCVIQGGETDELQGRTIAASYTWRYLPFHRRFAALPWQRVDQALWAYGKFLKGYRFPLVPLAPTGRQAQG